MEEEIFVKKYANTSLDNLIFNVVSLSSSRSSVNCNFIVGWCKAGGVCRNRRIGIQGSGQKHSNRNTGMGHGQEKNGTGTQTGTDGHRQKDWDCGSYK